MTDQVGLLVEREGPVLRLTLNRPERRNALSLDLLRRLGRALREAEREGSAAVVVLAARGPIFCSGHDLGEMTGRSEAEYRDLFAACAEMMIQIRRLPAPVIARVQGPAVAAGCQLVAACDLAIAASDATFATPGVKIGLFCTTPMVPPPSPCTTRDTSNASTESAKPKIAYAPAVTTSPARIAGRRP